MFKTILVSSALASAAAAGTIVTRDSDFACGAAKPSDAFLKAAKDLAAHESQDPAGEAITVEVHVHVISKDDTVEGGNVDDDTIRRQLDATYYSFNNHGFHFHWNSTSRKVDPAWNGDYWAKQPVRKGSYKDLNLYIVPSLPDGSLGSSSYPGADYPPGSVGFVTDGCTIDAKTMPSNIDFPFNNGATGTHEFGHWLGLLHTFEGACGADGDFILDTPAESTPAQGCPVDRDSCKDQNGVDPIHNFMDYTNDACKEAFTEGQGIRMRSMWQKFRAHPVTDGRPPK